uniref:Uncharacterized protein n=1 Tax=Arundo donax TaxID=35708 RepID=A0A0A9HBR7_ARUDO
MLPPLPSSTTLSLLLLHHSHLQANSTASATIAHCTARAEANRRWWRTAEEEDMGAVTPSNVLRRSCSFLAMLLWLQLLHPSQGFKLRGGYAEEKVPLAVIVPDPTPELSPAPLAGPPPLSGGGDDDMRPRLPTERWRRGRGEARRAAHGQGGAVREVPAPRMSSSVAGVPARAPAPSPAEAVVPAPDSGSGAAFIKSSPAVPVPRGVTDTATILPTALPGEKRQEVGAAISVRAGRMVPLLMLGFIMMASFGL